LVLAICFVAICCSPTLAGYADIVLADNPVGYWRLGETSGTKANDIAPGFEPPFRDGVYSGGITLGVEGPTFPTDGGKAADFDGSSGVVTIPPNPLFNQLTNNFTVEAWIKPDGVSGIQNVISARALIGDAGGWGLALNGNRIFFATWGIEGAGGSSPPVLAAGFWQHVVVVYDSNNTTNFYLNGNPVGTLPGVAPVNPNGQAVYIGRAAEWWGGPEYFNGAIGEVAIYNHALSAAEIQEHYVRALVPEPSSIVLGAMGAAAIGFVGRRRRRFMVAAR
jgi:hypothetical protein